MEFDYHGHAAQRVETKTLSLDVLSEAGPRIVGLRLPGRDENLLAELPDVHWDTPNGVYHIYGGHRLWYGPEVPQRTYIPDDSGVTIRQTSQAVDLIGVRETSTGVRKQMHIAFDSERPALTLTHQITNEGSQSIELAPWAVTQLPLGGKVIFPQTVGVFPPDDPHADLHANRHLVLWNYTRWNDPRLKISDDHIVFQSQALMPPCKFGYLNTAGWIAHQRGDILFVKRFKPQPQQSHIDRQCNIESYCNDVVLELETLGPLAKLAPGETVEHVEHWEFLTGIVENISFEEVNQKIGSLEELPW